MRDKSGLALLFVMPITLVVLMAYLQNSTFNAVTNRRIPIVLLNADKDTLGQSIESSIINTNVFDVTRKNADSTSTEQIEQEVADGNYLLGIVIPANTTKNIHLNMKRAVNMSFNSSIAPKFVSADSIMIFVDPTTQNSFRQSVVSSIREYVARMQMQFTLSEIQNEIKKQVPISIRKIEIPESQLVICEQYAQHSKVRIIPNSTQHNVAAWGLFAVFFIALTLSSCIIEERSSGCIMRLRLLGVSWWQYYLAKAIVCLLVCHLQWLIMLSLGVLLFPLIGLPTLAICSHWLALLVMIFSISTAAIGYGIAIGIVCQTQQQATSFSAISIVILAALGGVWIPSFVMPTSMQMLSLLSPMNWGLKGLYNLLVRDEDLYSVVPSALALLMFAAMSVLVANLIQKSRKSFIR